MLERLKDFLYDISDIVVSLLIIAAIFFSVSWKISDTLSFKLENGMGSPSQIAASENIPKENDVDNESTDDNDNIINIIPNATQDLPENETTSPGTDAIDETANTDSSSDDETTGTSPTLKTFVVPSGASGYSIGQQLASEGYIEDGNAFVNRLVERELDRKLFAGEFQLSTQDDLDTIITVLTGQGR
jgi:hypothetical protein